MTKKTLGRPTKFDQAVAAEICERIATTPRGLDFICDADEALPCARTVARWLADQSAFCQNYLLAKGRQADLIFDQSLEIADTPLIGIEKITKPDGAIETREGDMLGHRKLQVDTRLRMAGKLAPKKYGDKVDIAHSGDLTVTNITRKIVD